MWGVSTMLDLYSLACLKRIYEIVFVDKLAAVRGLYALRYAPVNTFQKHG